MGWQNLPELENCILLLQGLSPCKGCKASSYRDLSPKEIYRQHENGKKSQYASRVMEVEQGTFTPIVFTATAEMAEECKRYYNRLAELLATKRGED